MNIPIIMLLCRDIVWIIVWHKCDRYNEKHLWIITLQEKVDFSDMKWKKSLKIGGNVLQLVVNAMEKEKMLIVWTMIGLQKQLSTWLIFSKKWQKNEGKEYYILKLFFDMLQLKNSWNIGFKLSTHINGLIVISYKLRNDPAWHSLIG